MSVFSKIRVFFSRHRNKFIVGGILVTSTLFLTKYMQKRLRDWQEQETKEFLERTRKQSHFESINRTCNQTVLNLSSTLLTSIYQIINTDSTVEILKGNPINKLHIWNKLKVQVFAKAACIIYSLVMLVITLKIQLNVLGGYLYKDSNLSTEVQENYLSLCQDFLNIGVKKLADVIECEVGKLLEKVDLKKQIKLSDLEAIFWSLQNALASNEQNPVDRFRLYILEGELPKSEDIYSNMLRDTADLLESDEIKSLVTHHINKGFYVLGDQLSDFFTQNGSKISEIDNGVESFENPFNSKKPLAKLIPIMNGLLSKQSFPQHFIQVMVSDEKIDTLGANVYESLLI